jgi:RNA polymerase sigma-70 factor (ECF subfamily)
MSDKVMKNITNADQQILSELLSGNRKVFEELFRSLYPPLVRFACELLKDKDSSEDLVQEVFVKLWEKRERLQVHTSLKAYLYMAVKNHCLNLIKKEQRLEFLEEDEEVIEWKSTEQTDHRHQTRLLAQHIDQALERLPPRCALIFKMSRFEEKTYQEIADILELSIKTVENQMGKALSMMREYLSPYLNLFLMQALLHFLS